MENQGCKNPVKRKGPYNEWMAPTSKKPMPKSSKHRIMNKQLENLGQCLANENAATEEKLAPKTNKDLVQNFLSRLISIEDSSDCSNVNVGGTSQQQIDTKTQTSLQKDHDDEEVDWISLLLTGRNTTVKQNTVNDINENVSDKNGDVNFEKVNVQVYNKKQNNLEYLKKKIRKVTDISYGEVILMVMLLGARHTLNWVIMLDIIELINKIFPEDIITLSKYKLINFFPDNKEWYKYYSYCPQCKKYLGNRKDLTNTIICSCCNFVIPDTNKAPYFLTVKMNSQLVDIFEDPLIQPHLDYRFTRTKKNIGNTEDIFDADLYQFLSAPGGILNDKNNFSYIFNTDGCQASESGNTCIWPVYLKINELPPNLRNKHKVLVGIWVDENKPCMNTFFEPIVPDLNSLSNEGVEWKKNGNMIKSKIIPLCCSVDSPARCSLLNMKQYNGKYGCTFCYHPTENVNGFCKFPMGEHVPDLRTDQNIRQNMYQSVSTDPITGETEVKEVFGVKGPSVLLNLDYFDLSAGVTTESMHSVFLGAIKQHTEIIFTHVNEEYYVGSPSDRLVINDRLTSFKNPTDISRSPTPIENRSNWKASMWRTWLMIQCLICLEGLLPSKYLRHLSKLVGAMEIFLSDSISPKQREKARELLIDYVYLFQVYFGKDQMNYNIHLLLHLPDSVKNLGPVYVHDAFGFENENRLLLKLKCSSTKLAVQLAKRFMFFKSIPKFSTYFPIGSRVMEFMENFEDRVKACVNTDKTILTRGKQSTFTEKEESLGFAGTCTNYNKIFVGQKRYTTESYSKNLKTDDSVITLNNGTKGIITKICSMVSENHSNSILFFYHSIEIKTQKLFGKLANVKNIKECRILRRSLNVCEPKDVKNHCIIMSVGDKKYISEIYRGLKGD